MRKHFLILMLLTLLPLAGWAVSIDIDAYSYERSKDVVTVGEAAPTITITKAGSVLPITSTTLLDANKVALTTSITAGGLYYELVTFTDAAKQKTILVPFHVAEKVADDLNTIFINTKAKFNAQIAAANSAYNQYYTEYPYCDVWYQWGDTEDKGVYLNHGEQPSDTEPYKTGSYIEITNVETAKTWYNTLKGGAYGAKIIRSWEATKTTNPLTFAFTVNKAAATGEWDVFVEYGDHSAMPWAPTTFGEGHKTYGLIGVKDIAKICGVNITNADAVQAFIDNFNIANLKMTLRPHAALPAAILAPEAAATVPYKAVAQNLVTAGTAPDLHFYYAVVNEGAEAPAYGDYGDADVLPTKVGAGNYNVYWVAAADKPTEPAHVAGAKKIDVQIATAILTITPKPVGITYGDDPAGITNYYTVSYPLPSVEDTEEAVGLEVTPAWPSDLNAGTRTYTITATANTNYSVAYTSQQANFTVNKKAVLIKTKFDAPDHFYYGDNIPTLGVVFEGADGLTADPNELSFEVKKGTEIADTEAKRAWLSVGDWDITPVYTGTFDNYAVTVSPTTSKKTLRVEARDLSLAASNISVEFAGIAESNPYKGAAYEPTFKAYVGEGATKKEIPAASYSLKLYKTNTYADENTNFRNVGDFWVKVENKGAAANFTNAYTKSAAWFKIVPVTVTVQVSDFTKTYNKNKDLNPTEAGFKWLTFYTLKGEDKNLDFSGIAPSTTKEDAGEYTNELSVTEGALDAILGAGNYNYNIIKGKLTIKPATLTFAADATSEKFTKASGAADAFAKAYTITGYLGTETAIDDINAVIFQTDKAPKLVRADKSEIPGEYAISWEQGDKKTTGAAKNYTVSYTKPTVKLKINAAAGSHVVVTILPKSKTYNKVPTDFGTLVEGADHDYIVSGKLDGDVLEGTLALSYGDKEDAGVYELVGSGLSLSTDAQKHYDTKAWPTGIEYVNAEYTINPVEITSLTINEQMLKVGDDVKQLSAEYEAYTATEVLDGDDLGAVIIENVDGADTQAPHAAGALGVFEHGLMIDGFTNKNYKLKVAGTKFYGRLIRYAGETFVLDDQDADLATKLEDKDGNVVAITFSSRVLKAGQWNTLVLPFTTTVAELSQRLGYAVFDVLNEDNSNTETISLVLGFGELTANKPFMVQPAQDINMNTITFVGKKIFYSADPKVSDDADHDFIGTYVGHKVTSADKSEYYYSTKQKKFVNASDETSVGRMRAYLKDNNPTSAVRTITIQEADGSTTAIATIDADGVAVPAQGWYTVNGMKLEGVPTDKGIYINNGKKVVIK